MDPKSKLPDNEHTKVPTATPTNLPAIVSINLPKSLPVLPTRVPALPTRVPALPTSVPTFPTSVPTFPTSISAVCTSVPADMSATTTIYKTRGLPTNLDAMPTLSRNQIKMPTKPVSSRTRVSLPANVPELCCTLSRTQAGLPANVRTLPIPATTLPTPLPTFKQRMSLDDKCKRHSAMLLEDMPGCTKDNKPMSTNMPGNVPKELPGNVPPKKLPTKMSNEPQLEPINLEQECEWSVKIPAKLLPNMPEQSTSSKRPENDRIDIPIIKDGQYSNIEKFDTEISTVDSDKNEFCGHLLTISNLTSKDKDGLRMWDAMLKPPLIENQGPMKLLKLKFDINQFSPEELSVYVSNEHLVVHAKHEHDANKFVLVKEYHKEFYLPKGIKHENITSKISKEGVLLVEIVMPQNLEFKFEERIKEKPLVIEGSAQGSTTDESKSDLPNVLKKSLKRERRTKKNTRKHDVVKEDEP